MSTTTDTTYLDLSPEERALMQELLELATADSIDPEAFRGVSERLENHREILDELLRRVRIAGEADVVEVASEDSFPASDPPSHTPVAGVGPTES